MTNGSDSRAARRLVALFIGGAVLGLLWERLQFPFFVHEGGASLVWSHVTFGAIRGHSLASGMTAAEHRSLWQRD